jgi:4-hydroxy 2-oxovalerate aldolase
MPNIQILDCTLRDGGYVNDWNFGERKLKRIAQKLLQSKADILELGFLKSGATDVNKSLFNNVDEFFSRLEIDKPKDTTIVAMCDDKPSFDIRTLKERSDKTIDGIRFIFKPGDWEDIKKSVQIAQSIGFMVYINPMLTARYVNRELLALVEDANELGAEAVAIVDTFGSMHNDMLLYLFRLLQHNLDEKIAIGYHSHNNLQLAFSNALELINLHSKRKIILDSSCFGMGRGGGNLPTELIMRHLNDEGANYDLTPILDIIDNDLLPIYQKSQWGYSAPHFLSASMDIHPNYALYLMNMSRLTIPTIQTILQEIVPDKQANYDEKYIAELYYKHQSHHTANDTNIAELARIFVGKTVLVVAPGRTITAERDKIDKFINEEKPIIMSINLPLLNADYIFVGNQRRYDDLNDYSKVITTSNIDINDQNVNVVDFAAVTVQSELFEIDNSGMMCLRLLKLLGVSKIALAGFDGFTLSKNDYADNNLEYFSDAEVTTKRNASIVRQLAELRIGSKIEFITTTIYE